jgi:CubicO group peptidase (beta-lactamase class C family)
MSRFLICLWVVLLGGVKASGARPVSPFVPAKDLAELQARLGAILKEDNVPGMGVALADRDRVIWAAGIGLADVAAGKPAPLCQHE